MKNVIKLLLVVVLLGLVGCSKSDCLEVDQRYDKAYLLVVMLYADIGFSGGNRTTAVSNDAAKIKEYLPTIRKLFGDEIADQLAAIVKLIEMDRTPLASALDDVPDRMWKITYPHSGNCKG